MTRDSDSYVYAGNYPVNYRYDNPRMINLKNLPACSKPESACHDCHIKRYLLKKPLWLSEFDGMTEDAQAQYRICQAG